MTARGPARHLLGGAAPGGRLVANAVTVESEARPRRTGTRRSAASCARIAVCPGAPGGPVHRLAAGMTVTQWNVTKPGARGARMTVYFIGAGPGAADLITVRGQRLLEPCQVCLYAGSLVPADLLDACPAGARLVDTADLDLDRITPSWSGRPGRTRRRAAALRRPLDLQRRGRADAPAGRGRGAVRDRARGAGLRGRRGRARPGADGPDRRPDGDPHPGRRPGRRRCPRARTWPRSRRSGRAAGAAPGRRSTWTGWSPSCCRTTAPTARRRWSRSASRPDEVVLRGTLADIAGQVRGGRVSCAPR